MPQVKTKDSSKPVKDETPVISEHQHPTLADARDLIGQMLDYETTARATGIDLASSRFSMLTASERLVLRAELVADYIRLSAGNMGKTPGFFDASLRNFCSKICDMALPTHELVGTYLAAVDIISKDLHDKVPGLGEAGRKTMVHVLHGCVELMKSKVEQPPAVKA